MVRQTTQPSPWALATARRERDRRRECDGWQSDHIRQLDRDRCGWRRRVQHHANVHKQHSGRRSSTGYVDHRCGRQLTYTVDNNNATVQGLNAGETIVETYTVATEDGKDTQTITITINGAADDSAITVGSGDSAAESVTEDENVTDGNLTTSGSLTVTDADGDGAFNTTPTFTSSTVEGGAQLGTLTIDAEGNWTYTVDNNNATVQGLNAGETIVENLHGCDGGWQRYTNHHDHHQWCGRRLSHHRGLWRQRGRERDRRRECDGWQSDHIRQLDRDRCGWRRRVQHHANVHKQHSGRRSSTGYVDHRCGRQLTYTVDNNNATVQGLNAGETIVEPTRLRRRMAKIHKPSRSPSMVRQTTQPSPWALATARQRA